MKPYILLYFSKTAVIWKDICCYMESKTDSYMEKSSCLVAEECRELCTLRARRGSLLLMRDKILREEGLPGHVSCWSGFPSA